MCSEATSLNPLKIKTVEATTALKRCRWPCAADRFVVDTAHGCSFNCVFCPLRFHGIETGDLHLRVNVPDLLRRELEQRSRLGKQAPSVILNAATDSFQPVQALLALTHQSLLVLLRAGCRVHLRTRGEVPEGFEELFVQYADRLTVDVTFFSMDAKLAALYEPGAARPQRRLESIRRLLAWGVGVRARIQPMVPFITDTVGHLEELLRHLRSAGVERASASYLVLRPHVLERLKGRLPQSHLNLIKGSFKGTAWQKVGLHQMTRSLSARNRREGYDRLGVLAEKIGIEWHVCQCLNPDMGRSCFGALSQSRPAARGQLDLFPAVG